MLRVTGKGESVPDAIADALRAAVWYVLYDGDRPLLVKPLHKSGHVDLGERLFQQADSYIRYQSNLKGKRIIGGVVHVDLVVRVAVGRVRQDLAGAGVRPASHELAADVGLPTLAVRTDSTSPAARAAATTMLEYLQDRGFEVFDISDARPQNEFIKQLAQLEGIIDPAFVPALDTTSDIMIKVSASVSTGRRHGHGTVQASVTVAAHEVASQKMLGAATGHSPERVGSEEGMVAHEAANDAADKITAQIRSAWGRQEQAGRPFKVVLQMQGDEDGPASDSALYAALKSVSSRPVKRLTAGTGLSVYLVHARGFTNAFELFDALRRAWRGPEGLQKVHDAGAFLIVRAGGNDVEIEIEHGTR